MWVGHMSESDLKFLAGISSVLGMVSVHEHQLGNLHVTSKINVNKTLLFPTQPVVWTKTRKLLEFIIDIRLFASRSSSVHENDHKMIAEAVSKVQIVPTKPCCVCISFRATVVDYTS